MRTVLAIGAGGFVGALARYAVHVVVLRTFGPSLPLGTLTVNVTGSFALGLLFGLSEMHAVAPAVRLGLGVGVLGAFTTFSTFAIDTIALGARDGGTLLALGNVALNVVLSVGAAAVGIQVARSW
jgi:CrcB protein